LHASWEPSHPEEHRKFNHAERHADQIVNP
ncbi:hypothetical protein NPIL_165571, partial [Nephila pilipes]